MEDDWEEMIKDVWHPQYDYILEEINRLFEAEREKITKGTTDRKIKRKLRKNLQLIRIYLPEKDFKFLEKYRPFKRLHNLGGIPVRMIRGDRIRVDIEVVNPRKRKRKTVIYVREERK